MPIIRRAIIVAAVLGLLVAAGCGKPFRVTFEPSGAPLDTAGVEALARATDISGVSSVDVAAAPDVRDSVLRDLRTRGASGDRAATLLTQGFPPRTPSVPVLVRISQVSGKPSLIVVEAYGDAKGTLTHRRLWVFDLATGSVVQASSFR
jgi:hypothetical protein